jgi:SHS2 domain-containing protein
MTERRRVRPRAEREVRAAGADPAGLAVAFLNALILLHEDDGFLAREIAVTTRGRPPTSVVACVRGEPFDAMRHAVRTEVKAATLHDASFDAARGRARVIVDI